MYGRDNTDNIIKYAIKIGGIMTEENMKLMDEDKHHLLPDFYSEPILEMKFPKGLSQNQLSEIGANEHEDSLQLHYSEIEEQIHILKKILD